MLKVCIEIVCILSITLVVRKTLERGRPLRQHRDRVVTSAWWQYAPPQVVMARCQPDCPLARGWPRLPAGGAVFSGGSSRGTNWFLCWLEDPPEKPLATSPAVTDTSIQPSGRPKKRTADRIRARSLTSSRAFRVLGMGRRKDPELLERRSRKKILLTRNVRWRIRPSYEIHRSTPIGLAG